MNVQKLPPLILQKPLKRIPPELIIPLKVERKNLFGRKYYEYIYKMLDTSSMQEVAKMVAKPVRYFFPFQSYYPTKKPYKSFYVEYIGTNFSGFGYGTKLINLAKKESERLGCGGRVNLLASRVYDPKRPPHVFYKKCGFTSNNKFMNYILDKYTGELQSDNIEFLYDNLKMYLPIAKDVSSKIPSKMSKLLSEFKLKMFRKLASIGKKNPD